MSTFSCFRARSSTLPHLFPNLNPISLFGTILHAPTAFLAEKVAKFNFGEIGQRLSDRIAEHLRSVRNNNVDKPVARHFNAIDHFISDIKVCAISPISGGYDSRRRHEKRLIFKIGTIHRHRLNERFSFFFYHIPS